MHPHVPRGFFHLDPLWRKAVKDKELEALIRKNVAKASAPKAKKRPAQITLPLSYSRG